MKIKNRIATLREAVHIMDDRPPCLMCGADGPCDCDAPDDYERCAECGFDHEYEPEQAHAHHLVAIAETDDVDKPTQRNFRVGSTVTVVDDSTPRAPLKGTTGKVLFSGRAYGSKYHATLIKLPSGEKIWCRSDILAHPSSSVPVTEELDPDRKHDPTVDEFADAIITCMDNTLLDALAIRMVVNDVVATHGDDLPIPWRIEDNESWAEDAAELMAAKLAASPMLKDLSLRIATGVLRRMSR